MAPQLRVLLVDCGSPRGERNEPLGVCTLAAHLISHLGDRVIVSTYAYEFESQSLAAALAAHSPDVVGLSVSVGSLTRAKKVARRLSAIGGDKEPILVLGGVIPTFCCAHLLSEFPRAVCVIGEGEEALLAVVRIALEETLAHEGRWLVDALLHRAVPNVAMYSQNKTVVNHRATANLAVIPRPLRSYLRLIRAEQGLARIEASRGCPWNRCAYCSIAFKYCGSSWRGFPLERVVADTIAAAEYGVSKLYFTDEDFCGPNMSRVIDYCRALIELKANGRIPRNLHFFASTSVRSLLQDGPSMMRVILRAMKDCGFDELFLGIESGSKTQLERYNKGSEVHQAVRCIEAVRSADISLDVGFILLDPETTLVELQENLAFLRMTGLSNGYARVLKTMRVMPETELALRLEHAGMLGDLHPDEVMYRYVFVDGRVQLFAEGLFLWEFTVGGYVYELQTLMRTATDAIRVRELRDRLAMIRGIEGEFAQRLMEEIEVAKGFDEVATVVRVYADKVLGTSEQGGL